MQVTFSLALNYSDLIDPFRLVHNPCEDIRNGQFICQDCGTLSYCMQRDGSWQTFTVSECPTQNNLYCDVEARGCVYKDSCKETFMGPKFECQHVGVFPDPYDCKHYHVCDSKKEDTRYICPSGTAYSPASKTCSLTPNADICLKPQYECKTIGQMGAWPTDPSIYYVCHATFVENKQVRYPVLYQCQNGYIFNGNKCVIYTTPTLAPPPAPTAVPEVKRCTPGSGLTLDKSDCYSYYVCIDGLLQSHKCPPGTHYEDKTKSCTFGSC